MSIRDRVRFVLYLLSTGILATLAMDLTAVTTLRSGLFHLGRYQIGPALLGRWIGSLPAGQFTHANILESPSIPHEVGLGIAAHYVIGITLISFFICLQVKLRRRPITLKSSLLYGVSTTIFAWFLMFPAMGFGVMALKISSESMLTAFSAFNHVSFGFWIFVWSCLIARGFGKPGLASNANVSTDNEATAQQRHFWTYVASKYDAVVDLQIGPATRSMIRDHLSLEKQLGRTAEFGCGTGYNTDVLAGRSLAVVATDLSPGMLALAKEYVRASNVTFQEEDCQNTSFGDAEFDTAFLSLVIQFTDPSKSLSEMHRILKPGGKLILSNLDMHDLRGINRLRSWLRVVFYGMTKYRQKPPKHFAKGLLSGQQLCELLEQLGFAIERLAICVDLSCSSHIPVEYIRAIKL